MYKKYFYALYSIYYRSQINIRNNQRQQIRISNTQDKSMPEALYEEDIRPPNKQTNSRHTLFIESHIPSAFFLINCF